MDLFSIILSTLANDQFAKLTWRLWGAASVNDLKARCADGSLSLEKRKFALESIAFIDDPIAAEVMLEIASKPSPLKGQAVAWLLRNAVGEWAPLELNLSLLSSDEIFLAFFEEP